VGAATRCNPRSPNGPPDELADRHERHPPSPGHKAGSGPDNPKDKVENKPHTAVCAHTTTLAQAQTVIATDWTTALTVLHVN
jgi:hypothetical protein